MKMNSTVRIEYEVFLTILCIGLLNVLTFADVARNPQNLFQNFLSGTVTAIIIYGAFSISALIAIFLKKTHFVKYIFCYLLLYMTYHIVINLYWLIVSPYISDNGKAILFDAFLIWSVNILIFALWYWIIDRGGPVARGHEDEETRYDLLFPQYQGKIPGWEHWHPKLLDYVFFSFFTSTGFSPADTLPLTKRIKLLMMGEATISLIIIGMVVSRAISLIQ